MFTDNFTSKRVRLALICSTLILVLVPFHAFLTIWLSSIFGHYTALRLWSLGLLLIALLALKLLFWHDKALRKRLLKEPLIRLIIIYLSIQIIWGIGALTTHHVDAKALGYGLLVNVRFLLFFAVTWIMSTKSAWLHKQWPKLVFWPAVVVIVFGILQYLVLPNDFLKHFGYGPTTIYPFETINHNVHHIRILSTLRGANPLGAYLVVVLSLALVQFVRLKQKRLGYGLLGLAGILTLIFSFSRSAWLGFGVAAGVILVNFYYKSQHARHWLIAGGIGLLLVVGAGIAMLGHNTALQDALLHTDNHSTVSRSSNQDHLSALRGGLRDLFHEPLGRGPGTAGPASVYNNHPARIAENYFVQVGQETGWLGLLSFLAINILIACKLWVRRADPLALGLLAALIGVSVVNMLSHAWTDDTLAFLWWGLAGVAIAGSIKKPKPTEQ